MAATARLYRLVVPFGVGADGTLVPLAAPLRRVRAQGEGFLYQQLAHLVDADAATLAEAATRHGPLGPTSELGTVGDLRRQAWAMGELLGLVVAGIGELRPWIAAGSGVGAAIPGRLSLAAHFLIAFAGIDPAMMARFIWAEEQRTQETGERLSDEERLHFGTILWDQMLAAFADYARRVNAIEADMAQGDEPVRVRAPANVTADRLRLAARLMQSAFSGLGHEGGAAAVLEPASLASMGMLLGQYTGDPARGVPDTAEAWHRAASELRVWKEGVRLLRALTAGRPVGGQLQMALAQLRWYAGVVGPGTAPPPSFYATDLATLRAAAGSLLSLRLRQVHAWPLPGEEEVVGAFARALWSLWHPITGGRPPQRCQWRDGCSRQLPDDAHGNRKYCREHQKQASRERAARSRLRTRHGADPSHKLGGLRQRAAPASDH